MRSCLCQSGATGYNFQFQVKVYCIFDIYIYVYIGSKDTPVWWRHCRGRRSRGPPSPSLPPPQSAWPPVLQGTMCDAYSLTQAMFWPSPKLQACMYTPSLKDDSLPKSLASNAADVYLLIGPAHKCFITFSMSPYATGKCRKI